MVVINKLYGALTRGDGAVRRTTIDYESIKPRAKEIAEALTFSTTAEAKRQLAEIYIRLIQTDKELENKLNAVDPLNTYKLAKINLNGLVDFDLASIEDQLKRCTISGEELSGTVWDLIRAALSELLDNLG